MSTTLNVNPSNPIEVPIKKCENVACTKNNSTLLKCSRCQSRLYCGPACQLADWPQHKKVCKPQTTTKESKQEKFSFPLEQPKQSVLGSSIIEKSMPIPGLRLIKNFISDDLHERFIKQMSQGIPEVNDGHYDGYVFDDDQAFDKVFYELTQDVFSKLKKLGIFSEEKKPLKLACTLLGYEKDGYIDRHVDSSLLSAGSVVVISFNSPVVVNFYSEKKVKEQQHKIFIPPKSMYSISGEARYDWSHAILKDEDTYKSKKFDRKTRYAIVFTPPGPCYPGTELFDY